jgi:hypothetical protein
MRRRLQLGARRAVAGRLRLAVDENRQDTHGYQREAFQDERGPIGRPGRSPTHPEPFVGTAYVPPSHAESDQHAAEQQKEHGYRSNHTSMVNDRVRQCKLRDRGDERSRASRDRGAPIGSCATVGQGGRRPRGSIVPPGHTPSRANVQALRSACDLAATDLTVAHRNNFDPCFVIAPR